jgi:hypothetical protein
MSARLIVDAARVEAFMEAAGRAAAEEGVCFLVGGATAVLVGWRDSTIDVDIRLEPAQESVLRCLEALKQEQQINVELASPRDFVPLPAGWRARSPTIRRVGRLTFCHFDLYSQALAKLERGHTLDLADVAAMLELGLVEREVLRRMYDEIEPELFRFPAIDRTSFRAAVEAL